VLLHAVTPAGSPLGLRERERCLGGKFPVTVRQKSVSRHFNLLRAFFGAEPSDLAVSEEKVRIVGCERKGIGVIPLSSRERVQRCRAVAGIAERTPCTRLEVADILTGSARELETGGVVVGKHLGVVVEPPE
jgi:hypothetical protein